MASIKQIISSVAVQEAYNYIEKNPVENLSKLLDWAERLAILERHKTSIKNFKNNVILQENNWNTMMKKVLTETHPKVVKSFVVNFFAYTSFAGVPKREEMMKKHGCNIPWTILIDPTTACNLNCIGCWAAEYEKTYELDYNVLDRVFTEGKQLGMYIYFFSGGEPLLRKDDLIKLAEKHHECIILVFTNATLIDEAFAKELQRVGNIFLSISIEGFEEETDMRRGKGTYKKVMEAMDILKEHGIGFGFSTCYHKENAEVIGSEEYLDLMVEKGCLFGWYFTYMPVGNSAPVDLLATPEQREYMYHQVRKFRKEKPIFIMDFWNDGEFVGGCVAGGKAFFHLNANGDAEPCAFVHYSNVNIHDHSLLEVLKSPLFLEYGKNQPFNDNHLRPCPILDNPDRLKEIVHKTNAQSTQVLDKESVDELTDKCQDISKQWADVADRLWYGSERKQACK